MKPGVLPHLALTVGVQLDEGLLNFVLLPVWLVVLPIGKDGKLLQCPNLLFQLLPFVHDQGGQLVYSLAGPTSLDKAKRKQGRRNMENYSNK